jgi:hypothetical protein
VGVIITRCDELQVLFEELGWVQDKLGRWQRLAQKYGSSTTHWGKLIPRVESGGGGACPLLLIGIRRECYIDDIPKVKIIKAKP